MGRLALQISKFHKNILFRLVWYWHKNIKLLSAIEGTEVSPSIGRELTSRV